MTSSEATARGARCAVAAHLATHRRTADVVQQWCDGRADRLSGAGVTVRTSDRALRQAVPGLDWRSDRGRAQLREHLPATAATLFSSAALLGPAFRHTGGRLFADAGAGVDAIALALRETPARVHLSIDTHATTMVRSWTDAVRAGHAVTFDDFVASVVEPSWVPLVERLARAVGSDRVVVHGAGHTGTATGCDRTTGIARGVLDTLLDDLAIEPDDDLRSLGTGRPWWTARQTEVALAMLPHLRSRADRTAMRTFVDEHVDRGGEPVWPVPAVLTDDLAARDAADLARLDAIVEVR
jgi:hypothetical protein